MFSPVHIESFRLPDLSTLTPLQPEGWSSLIPIFEFYTTSEYSFPIKVVAESVTIGVGCAICFEGSAWLAHIIVHPQYRRKGVGTMIVEELLSQLEDRRIDRVSLVATDDGHPLYRSFGFTEDSQYVFFKSERLLKAADESRVVTAADSSDDSAILTLDRLVSGEARESLLKPHLDGALICREAGPIGGLYLPTLGEGLIEARSVVAGEELMRHRLRTHNQCILPADNVPATTFLKENGYSEVRRAWRMWRGERPLWHPEWVFSRIAGNFG